MSSKPKPPVTVEDIDSAPVSTGAPETGKIAELREAFTRVSEEKAQLQVELDALAKKVRTLEILDDLIEPYAKRAFAFMCCYCGAVGIILLLHGFRHRWFFLPESVLDFLVGSTAVTVIGLVGMVLTGIFVGARPKR
ncbi:MAG: hypothetical protein ABL866_05960 [Devosia sp.]